MSTAWFMYPLAFDGSREFMCDDLTDEQCAYYQERWHFWYEADHVFSLSVIAFFVTTIGVFSVSYVLNQVFQLLGFKPIRPLQRVKGGLRYLSYRGYRINALKWNSAPLGVLLLGAVGAIFFFLITLVPQPYYWPDIIFGDSPPLGTRAGWLGLACMPFVFATAGKASWVTLVTGVSHEKLQTFHRWIAYAFFILGLVHAFPFIVYHQYWGDLYTQVTQENLFFYWTGIVAIVVQAWLTIASFSTFRNLSYEFFKIMHFAAVILFVIFFFWHCGGTLSSWDYFVATAAVYVPGLVYPWLRTLFEYGIGQRAYLHLEENGFIRITIPAKFNWVPGQHCFLRFTGLGIHGLTTHPFTICSLPPMRPNDRSELVFYVRKKGGLTARLHDLAAAASGQSIAVLVDGPYGGVTTQELFDSERVVLVAGGSGAGWTLPFVELFARRNMAAPIEQSKESSTDDATENEERALVSNTPGLLSMRLILSTRDIETRTWFLDAVKDVSSRYTQQVKDAGLEVEVHLTGTAEQALQSSDNASPASSVVGAKTEADTRIKTRSVGAEQVRGRPHLSQLLAEEAQTARDTKQSLGVYVCGPTEMQNDVRNAVAKQNLAIFRGAPSYGVYLHTEHFSWA